MAFFKIVAGNFKEGSAGYSEWGKGSFVVHDKNRSSSEKIPMNQVSSLEVATEDSVKRLGGTVGWGIAGNALFGPVGLLAGLLRGGEGKDITFICQLNDGRKFLATAKSGTFKKINAAFFNAQTQVVTESPSGERGFTHPSLYEKNKKPNVFMRILKVIGYIFLFFLIMGIIGNIIK
ncbi:TPA: hypothetical protein O7W21_004767 [Salmonella enterica]|nr:hypothetical protein [Salmonella enterica]